MTRTSKTAVTLAFIISLFACSRGAVQGVEIEQSFLEWSRDQEFGGKVVLRNSGKLVVAGTLELICVLDLSIIKVDALEAFVGDISREEWREGLTSMNLEGNPFLQAFQRYLNEDSDSDLPRTWDIKLTDPEEPTYAFSFYVEVNLLPGVISEVHVSSPVPNYLYGRAYSLSVGALMPKAN